MNNDEAATWLRTFYSHPGSEAEAPGDDIGTTVLVSGAVVLASALTSIRSRQQLAKLLGLPVNFVAVAIANMDLNHLWTCENFQELCCTIHADMGDHDKILVALCHFMQEFWTRSKLPIVGHVGQPLFVLRADNLLFGKKQSWIHKEYSEELFGPN